MNELLSLFEACAVLHVDAGINDDLISSLIAALPGYIEVTTGMSPADQLNEPLAKSAAGFILTTWYYGDHSDTDKLQRVTDSLLKAITVKANQVKASV